jgi:hypothetical protein
MSRLMSEMAAERARKAAVERYDARVQALLEGLAASPLSPDQVRTRHSSGTSLRCAAADSMPHVWQLLVAHEEAFSEALASIGSAIGVDPSEREVLVAELQNQAERWTCSLQCNKTFVKTLKGGRLDELFEVNREHAKAKCRHALMHACSNLLISARSADSHEWLTASSRAFDRELAASKQSCRAEVCRGEASPDLQRWLEEVFMEEEPKVLAMREQMIASAIVKMGLLPALLRLLASLCMR